MTGMRDPAALAAFVKARSDEDEQSAWAVHDVAKCDALLYEEDMAAAAARTPDCDCGYPARVRREVAAKRKILASLEEDLRLGARTDLTRGGQIALFVTCKRLAAVWSDHPDYDQGWK